MAPLRKIGRSMRKQWMVALLGGILVGLLVHIFYASRASSYLSDKPETCINCHVMIPQYAAWQRGSHRRAATCNDCHVPQDNIFRTYFFKAADGLRHAFVFTFRLEPQAIVMKAAGQEVVQENCIRCHQKSVHPVLTNPLSGTFTAAARRPCWQCHRQTPHGRVRSLASSPNVIVPRLDPLLPDWLIPADNINETKNRREEP